MGFFFLLPSGSAGNDARKATTLQRMRCGLMEKAARGKLLVSRGRPAT